MSKRIDELHDEFVASRQEWRPWVMGRIAELEDRIEELDRTAPEPVVEAVVITPGIHYVGQEDGIADEDADQAPTWLDPKTLEWVANAMGVQVNRGKGVLDDFELRSPVFGAGPDRDTAIGLRRTQEVLCYWLDRLRKTADRLRGGL